MNKADLIRTLTSASELEEAHTPLVAKFLLEDFDWGDIEKEKVDRVKKIIGVIKEQTLNHEKILSDMIGLVNRSDQDDF
jgi:hypothetical protein